MFLQEPNKCIIDIDYRNLMFHMEFLLFQSHFDSFSTYICIQVEIFSRNIHPPTVENHALIHKTINSSYHIIKLLDLANLYYI